MKISVVTACFNSAKTIRFSINSFLGQGYRDKEMIIVDGGSTDGTLQIVGEFDSPQIRVISEPDKGIYDAMNKGLRLYDGDAVGFLNSDDTFHDEFALGRIATALQTAEVAYGDLNMVTDHKSKATKRIWRAGAFHPYAFQLGWAAPHPTFYVRRCVIEKVGEFVDSYTIAADYDFMIRALALHKFHDCYIPYTLVDFQLGGMSSADWKATLRANLECWDVRRKRLDAPLVDAALFLRPARRIYQQCVSK